MTSAIAEGERYPDIWRKFTPQQTLIRYAWLLGIVFVAAWSLRNLDIPWFYFLDAHEQAGDLFSRMFPATWEEFAESPVEVLAIVFVDYYWETAQAVWTPLIETIHIATPPG